MGTFIIDLVLIWALGLLTPNYSPVRQYISELPLQNNVNHMIFTLWWSLYTIPFVYFAYVLHKNLPKIKFGWMAPALLAFEGLALGIIPAIFTCDQNCTTNSVGGIIHLVSAGGIAALIDFVFVPLLVLRMKNDSYWKPRIKPLLVLWGIYLITLIFSSASGGVILFGSSFAYAGLLQRVNLVAFYGLIGYLAVLTIRQNKS